MDDLTGLQLTLLILVFFATSVVSVVTGSTSLVTVPVLLQVGIRPDTALATNMLALACMSVGGMVAFLRTTAFRERRLPRLGLLTFIGSALGAALVPAVPAGVIPVVVSLAMMGMVWFAVVYRDSGLSAAPVRAPSPQREAAGWVLSFLLAVYGGFFSGGYVTLLTAVFIATFGFTMVESVATTKLLNVISSFTEVACSQQRRASFSST